MVWGYLTLLQPLKKLFYKFMVTPGRYRHSKSGKEYQVIGIGKHSETLEDVVIYEPLYKQSLARYWIRPLSMFEEMVVIEGKEVPRFARIAD